MRRGSRIAQLQQGTEIVDLGMVSQFGDSILSVQQGGISSVQFTPQQLEQPASTEDQLFSERWSLVARERRVDNLSSSIRRISRLLRQAWKYQNANVQITPVYLIAQVPGETNVRTALVHSSPSIQGANPLFNVGVEDERSILDYGVQINRFAWRAGTPSVLPTKVCLEGAKIVDATLGAEMVLNPGFETAGGGGADVFAGWTEFVGDGAIARTTTAGEFHSGVAAAKLTSGPTNNSNILQTFVIVPGRTYDVSVWMRGDTAAGSLGRFYVIDYTEVTWTPIAFLQGAIGATFIQYTYRFTAPPGMTVLALYCLAPTTNGRWVAYDDVSLKEVHSPCSTMVSVVNYMDNHDIDTVFCVDNSAGPAYSANLISSASFPIFSVAGSNPAVNDSIMFGDNEPFFSVSFYVGTAAVGVYTVTPYLSVAGPAWTALTAGSGYTAWPSSVILTSLSRTGWVTVSFSPGAIVWAPQAFNGVTKYWLRLEISAFTSTATTPVTSTYAPMNNNRPYFTIPASTIKGDAPPYAMFRLRQPAGSTTTPELGTTSRIILASKSRNLSGFTPVLNAGNDGNASLWTVTYGTDAVAAANVVAPGGDHCAISFATSTTMQMRARFTGVDVLPSYIGKYRVFARMQQVGGAAGDVQVKYRALINGSAAGQPLVEGPTVKMAGVSLPFELVDLTPGSFLILPFGQTDAGDTLTNADLVLEIHVERIAGASTAILYDVWFMPCDEWICDLDDPITDITNGSSALRGSTGIDLDNGIIMDRTVKELFDYAASVSTPPIYPAETWNRRGQSIKLEPARDNNIYALSGNFPSVWGTGPFVANPGKNLELEVFIQPVYFYLRGDD